MSDAQSQTAQERAKVQERIEAKLKLLPDLPGCYLMKDAADQILYVGKAKNLKNRVRSYFRGARLFQESPPLLAPKSPLESS